ncbi:MAG TPA: hypothetical protein P5333_05005 [Caldilinea sp.]|nr:hypothetical protein [Caldilinea sp.]
MHRLQYRSHPGVLLAAVALVAVALLVRRQSTTPDTCHEMEPERVAALEAGGWKAYYDRDWPRVLMLMVQMNRTQFCMGWLDAMTGALDIVRAAAAFAPVDNDVPAATAHLARFYAKARLTAGLPTDAATLAALEMDYWIVHRTLAVARKAAPDHAGDIAPMTAALERLHAALFSAPPAAIHRSAAGRAQAAALVDRITGGYSPDVGADWAAIEHELSAAYRAVAPAAGTTH